MKKNVRKRGAEVGAIESGVAGGFRIVQVFASGAVQLDELDVRSVRHTGG